ncbi:MAG TPA: 16S rRNA (uracil(1498)-N(3))-methyltransferase [Micromonosporaceae bacterium]|nr:16S rRNA (uracil(1498)-N(3))-methyltransferase [Micromonosporaceae bacterium]
MSPPMFLVSELPAGGAYTLDGPEGHHAANVQRLGVSERLLLGDGRGGMASAVVTTVGRADLGVTINDRWYVEPPRPRLVVAQGIPKGDRAELAVQIMTEVGVDEIVPWAAARCVAIWRGDRAAKARDKWAATAREATKQARRPWLPVVAESAVSTAAIATRTADLVGTTPPGAVFVLDEDASTPLTVVPLPPVGDIVIVVGPEGGIAPEELVTLMAVGAVPVRLGPHVLRTSTAGAAALSALATRLGRW